VVVCQSLLFIHHRFFSSGAAHFVMRPSRPGRFVPADNGIWRFREGLP
jgi:hypothetical protein